MRNLAASLLALVVLCCGDCQANEFFEGLVGRWKGVSTSANVERNLSYKMTFRLLRSGVLYGESNLSFRGQTSVAKVWLYPKGTARGVNYFNGKETSRINGDWQLRQGELHTTLSSGREKTDSVWRRVSNRKYVVKSTKSDGSSFTSTLTRIRN
jgi:hypothetical protein